MCLDLSTHQKCQLKDCSMVNFTTFTWSSQKLPSAGGECTSILMFIFCSSFHTMAGKYPSPWSLCHPASVSFSVQNSSASLFLFSLPVPQHCTALVCKSPNKETVHIVCVSHFPALQGVQLQLHEWLSLRDSHIACFCPNTLAYCTYIP
jgi:hypothetical protein